MAKYCTNTLAIWSHCIQLLDGSDPVRYLQKKYLFKMSHPRPLVSHLFLLFSNINMHEFTTNKYEKWSIQYPMLRFELTTSCTCVSSHNHQTTWILTAVKWSQLLSWLELSQEGNLKLSEINVKNCPISSLCWDQNPRPLRHMSPLKATTYFRAPAFSHR